jgi:hypothetical protein
MTSKAHLDAGQPAPFGRSAPSTAGFDHHLLAAKAIYRCPSWPKARSWPRSRRKSGECRLSSTRSWRGHHYGGADNQRKGTSMPKQRVTKSLAAAAAIMGVFAAHAATAQQTPAGSMAHFVYFATGGYALTPEDQDHIRDVAGMMHPSLRRHDHWQDRFGWLCGV